MTQTGLPHRNSKARAANRKRDSSPRRPTRSSRRPFRDANTAQERTRRKKSACSARPACDRQAVPTAGKLRGASSVPAQNAGMQSRQMTVRRGHAVRTDERWRRTLRGSLREGRSGQAGQAGQATDEKLQIGQRAGNDRGWPPTVHKKLVVSSGAFPAMIMAAWHTVESVYTRGTPFPRRPRLLTTLVPGRPQA